MRVRVRGGFVALISGLLAFGVSACGGNSNPPPAPAGQSPQISGKITIFAAASLTDAFTEIGASFEEQYPKAGVVLQFAGSPTLRTQLEQGARADVYASADQANMDLARQNGVVADSGTLFAHNSLVLITPSNNPGKVSGPVDLARPGLKLILANANVPAGSYARQMLASMEKDGAYGPGFKNKVLKNLVSDESDVKQVVAKVQLGEADAGVVYGTDVTPSVAPKLKTLAVPPQFNVVAGYAIAVTKDAANPKGARAFIDFVLSPAGQQILKKYGFATAS